MQADPMLPPHAADTLGGAIEVAVRAAGPQVAAVLVHMEPHVVLPPPTPPTPPTPPRVNARAG